MLVVFYTCYLTEAAYTGTVEGTMEAGGPGIGSPLATNEPGGWMCAAHCSIQGYPFSFSTYQAGAQSLSLADSGMACMTSALQSIGQEIVTKGNALEDLSLKVHRAMIDLVRVARFRDRDRVCCYDVSVCQSHALDRLRRLGPLTMNSFAELLYIEKSTASRLVDGLVEKGYVTRTKSAEDGRRTEIAITRSGERLAARVEGDMVRAQAAVLEDFTADERTAIAQAIEKLAKGEAARVSFSRGVGSWS
jgi:DNA-binding MarR family transcriptional regulator